jgi:hypothetical protein
MVEGPLRFRTAMVSISRPARLLIFLLLYEEAAALWVRLIITGEVAMPFLPPKMCDGILCEDPNKVYR